MEEAGAMMETERKTCASEHGDRKQTASDQMGLKLHSRWLSDCNKQGESFSVPSPAFSVYPSTVGEMYKTLEALSAQR